MAMGTGTGTRMAMAMGTGTGTRMAMAMGTGMPMAMSTGIRSPPARPSPHAHAHAVQVMGYLRGRAEGSAIDNLTSLCSDEAFEAQFGAPLSALEQVPSFLPCHLATAPPLPSFPPDWRSA